MWCCAFRRSARMLPTAPSTWPTRILCWLRAAGWPPRRRGATARQGQHPHPGGPGRVPGADRRDPDHRAGAGVMLAPTLGAVPTTARRRLVDHYGPAADCWLDAVPGLLTEAAFRWRL